MEWWHLLLIVVGSLLLLFILSIVLYKPFFKRFWDIALSLLALTILSPLFLILTITGAIAMKGNPFFVQKRPGMISRKTGKEKIFPLIKFRTMSNAKDKNGNILPDEKRLNSYGKLLRSTSLDEFPEALNIFVGHMSIIGPRPQLIRDLVFMNDEQRNRHNVRPGLSGLAQVNGRNNITWEQKFEFDIEYVSNVSLWKDIGLIFKTVGKMFSRADVVREGTESDIDFGDWLLKEGKISKEQYDIKQRKAKELLNKD